MQFAKNSVSWFALLFILGLPNLLVAQADESNASSTTSSVTTLLKNATIHPMNGQANFVGSILIKDGKIAAVGSEIEAPEDAKIIDLEGCHAVPGLVDSRSRVWLTSAASSESNAKAELDVVDAIDPWSDDWRELASQGITSAYVQQNSTSFLGGYGAVLRVGDHGSVAAIVLKEQAALQASIGTKGSTSKDRHTQIKALEKLLEAAKPKDKAKKTEENDKKEEVAKDKKGSEAADKSDDASKKDAAESDKKKTETAATERLRRVFSKEIPLHVEVHHSDSVKQILKLAKKYELRLVLDGLSQANRCCEEIAESGFPVVVGPLYETGSVPAYRKYANFDWLSAGLEDVSLWSLGSFASSARSSRMLRVQAATAIRHGVAREAALAAMTSNAARMLGVADKIGTLEAGKQADIAVFAGDPLDPSAPTRLVLSHGKITFDRNAVPVNRAAMSDSLAKMPSRLPPSYAINTSRMLVDGKFQSGTLVIKDGHIVSTAITADTKNVLLYDLGDAIVTPGLVIASSSLGQASAITDASESDATHLRSVDAIDPSNKIANQALAGGFVHVAVTPAASSTSAGMVGHVRLGASDYVADPEVANLFVLTRSARQTDRFPASLNGQVQLLSDLFAGQPPASNIYVSSPVQKLIRRDKIHAIESVHRGERRAIFAADSNLEIRTALALTKQFKFSLTLHSAGRVGEFATELAEQKIGLIVPAIDSDAFDSMIEQTVTVSNAGVPIGFAGQSAQKIRVSAALLVNAGMTPEAALRGLTEDGSDVAGLAKTGLKQGNAADFVVWNGSPLNLSAQPVHVIVDGQIVSPK
ncbi:MAG: imidazolonepropionase-like amidohydrolase [Mariniblastus sp.]|jgi:imidazolonepropionase-like amidohydrolase